MSTFYLASHDYISSPQPRRCEPIAMLIGMHRDDCYLLVNIDPLLPGQLFGLKADLKTLVLSPCGGKDSLKRIGKEPVMVDILSPAIEKDTFFDESKTYRIGVGTLHASLKDANAFSPLED